MFKKNFWDKFSVTSNENKKCSVCDKNTNNFIVVDPVKIEKKVLICKDCALDNDAISKEAYIKSLNEMHLEKDLLSDVILIYDKYINSNPERKNDYDRFKEQWELRKDIRNIDG